MSQPTYYPEPGERAALVVDQAVIPCTVRAVVPGSAVHVTDAGVLQLRRPLLEPGACVIVTWQRPDAEYRLPAVFVRVGADGWLELRPAAQAERVQRRRHVRARLSVPVAFTDHRAQGWEGVTLDVSESGLRCRLPKRADLAAGAVGIAAFSLDQVRFLMAVDVLWLVSGDEWTHEVGLRFIEPGKQSDAVREWVFAFQIRNRHTRPA
jgi:hypothetical protein